VRVRVLLAAAALAVLGAWFAPAPLRAQAPPTDRPEVVAVDFEGNSAFSRALLRSAIVTAPTRCRAALLLPLCAFGLARDRDYLDPKVVRADSLRLVVFYYERGYRGASVAWRTEPEDRGVRVVFNIREGELTRVESVVAESADGEELPRGITDDLPLVAGGPFDLRLYEAARDTLRMRLLERGYARAEVLAGSFVPRSPGAGAEVRYDIIAGPRARFGPIEVLGAQKVSPTVVRRMLTFRPGDVYRSSALLRSQRNLFSLDIFKHAEMRPQLDAEPDTIVPVLVQVNEGATHRVRVGVGLTTDEALNAEGRWASRNFLGGARSLEVRGRVSNVLANELSLLFPWAMSIEGGIYDDLSGSLGVDFVQPWIFGPLNTLGAGAVLERRSVPGVFVRTVRGGYLSFSRALGRGTTVTLGYRPEYTKLETEGDLLFCVNFVACEYEDIQLLRTPHWLAPVTLLFVRDHSNSLLAPTHGTILRLEAEHARPGWTGSEFAYTRALLDLSAYEDLVPGLVLAARIRAGGAWDGEAPDDGAGLGLHPQRRFFAGGANSVRGFAQYGLGPRVLTVDAADVLARPAGTVNGRPGGAGCTAQAINAGECNPGGLRRQDFEVRPVGGAALLEANLELRFPLYGEKLRAAAFVDAGQVWRSRPAGGWRSVLDDMVWSPGIGFRYFSAAGPIRVDIGYNTQGAIDLPVVTTEVCAVTPDGGCEPIEEGRTYDPAELRNTPRLRPLALPYTWNREAGFLDRLQLHISIGQAF